jgi:ATP-dependent Lon protease
METFPLVPLREQVMFPGIVLILDVSGPAWDKLTEEIAQGRTKRVLLATQTRGDSDTPSLEDLSRIAVLSEVVRLAQTKAGHYRVIVRGIERARVRAVVQVSPFLAAEASVVEENEQPSEELDALVAGVRVLAKKFIELSPDLSPETKEGAQEVTDGIESAGLLADRIAPHLGLPIERRLAILGELDVTERLRLVEEALLQRIEVLGAVAKGDPGLREKILREKMKAIQEELGEPGDPTIDELEEKILAAKLPAEPAEVAKKELRRLRGMNAQSPDYTVTRTYLEWIADLPWSVRSEDQIDLDRARKILDDDHHGLEKIKKRVLEYLAVRKLKPDKKGPILLFAGPPGVGKTSLGRSIASALGRKFVRASLGGVRDEASIRGHRRTYIGALPGRIIQALKQAGTRNPVFLLDEIDKLGADFRGDPSSALLEVLDPEQNSTVSDHYLEVPFDLSEVIFIATANDLGPIPAPLRDRMELIALDGYTPDDKRAIAIKHLVPKQLHEHGLTPDHVTFTEGAIDEIIGSYTREAGVRNLEREIAAVVRGLAVKVAAGEEFRAEVLADDVATFLGPPKWHSEMAEETSIPGVVTGLAWTPTGGEILFVEASRMPGTGRLVLTGQLGEVMKESAQAALSYVRAHATQWELDPTLFGTSDLHLHVPAGAIPKDGPSAGNAIVTALVSLLTGRKVRGDVAMTGEITLRGNVLPVGGIGSKLLAAHRAGAKRVILPERNAKDVAELTPDVRDALDIVLVKKVDETLHAALEPAPATTTVTPPAPLLATLPPPAAATPSWVARGVA